MRYADMLNEHPAPVTERTRPDQVKNEAGGYVFEANAWTRLERFLILGADTDTYYVGKQKLARDNAGNLLACIAEDGIRTVDVIAQVSNTGRAPKNDAAIFALALCVAKGNPTVKAHALAKLTDVCRTGTHLFAFLEECKGLGVKWGRMFKRGVTAWYLRDATSLGFQLMKYRQRGGWSHQDALRLTHPKTEDAALKALFAALMDKTVDENLPKAYKAFMEISEAGISKSRVIDLIQSHRLPWEVVPTEMHKDRDVWAALLPNMGYTALVRNLGRLSNLGLTEVGGKTLTTVLDKLGNVPQGRIHPIQLMIAMKRYSSGKGDKGDMTWTPCSQVTKAINDAFYLSFDKQDKCNKSVRVAIDVSGSMSMGSGVLGFRLHEVAGCMAMAVLHAFPNSEVIGVDGAIHNFDFHGRRLDDVARILGNIQGGITNLALVHEYKTASTPDMTVMYSDNITWQGHHVHEAWAKAKRANPNAKTVNVVMVPNHYSLHPQEDQTVLQVAGFDASVPSLIAAFLNGPTSAFESADEAEDE